MWLGILVTVLVFGMTVVGCASSPKTFVRGSTGDTTILLRDGLEYDRAFREIAFVLNRHGFESETIQPEVGYIRTRWTRTTWSNASTELFPNEPPPLDLYRHFVYTLI